MRYEESAVLELKEQVNADFKKEIIAFANTDGGEIFVGVAKDGSITGGENAEAEMEHLTGQLIDTLAHTNKEERAYALVRLLHSGRWQGVMDRDDVLAHLEEHLAELAKLLERPEGEVFSTLEQERAEIAAKLRQEYPEVSQQLAEHRQALAHYLKERYPETSRHLEEVRERFQQGQHD